MVSAVLCLHACKFLPHFAFNNIRIPFAVPSPPATAKEGVILLVDVVSFPLADDFCGKWGSFDETISRLHDLATGEGMVVLPCGDYYGVECYFHWQYNGRRARTEYGESVCLDSIKYCLLRNIELIIFNIESLDCICDEFIRSPNIVPISHI